MPLSNASNASSSSVPPFSVNPNSFNPDTDADGSNFVDRRGLADTDQSVRSERRQFGSSHTGLSDDGRELALAIDEYKIQHHRRYLTCDEMLQVLSSLGYAKQS
jgi:hypothetical protein